MGYGAGAGHGGGAGYGGYSPHAYAEANGSAPLPPPHVHRTLPPRTCMVGMASMRALGGARRRAGRRGRCSVISDGDYRPRLS